MFGNITLSPAEEFFLEIIMTSCYVRLLGRYDYRLQEQGLKTKVNT